MGPKENTCIHHAMKSCFNKTVTCHIAKAVTFLFLKKQHIQVSVHNKQKNIDFMLVARGFPFCFIICIMRKRRALEGTVSCTFQIFCHPTFYFFMSMIGHFHHLIVCKNISRFMVNQSHRLRVHFLRSLGTAQKLAMLNKCN